MSRHSHPCRRFLRLQLTALLATLFAQLDPTVAADVKPTNFVFILVDDLGQRDLGCYGSSFYETPNIDALARQGARFTDAYAACPVCSPTRASIMTGQYPQRTGITDYIGAAQPEGWKRNTKLLPAAYSTRLELEELTLADSLKTKGYATFFAGKWHMGPEGFWPENQGFDVNIGGIDKGGPYGGKRYFSPYGNPRLPDGPEGEHLPDRLARETVKFMEANRDKPFLTYLSFYSVHTPLMARPDLAEKYQAKAAALPPHEPRFGREEPRDVRLVQDHPVYASMVEAMDQAVGKVLKGLKDLGLEKTTAVILTSDNGGLSTSEGWPTSNLPLRGGKGWLYEGGIREPLIIRWPGVSKPGSIVSVPVISPDFFTTIARVASAPPPKHRDGIDLRRMLRGGESPGRPLYWHYPHYGNQGGAPGSAIREGKWKLIEWLEDGKLELYNLAEDIGEKNDVAAANPEVVGRLKTKLDAWRQDVGAKMPAKNPAYTTEKPDGRESKRPTEKAGAAK